MRLFSKKEKPLTRKEWIEVMESAKSIAHIARQSSLTDSAVDRFANAEVIFTILCDALKKQNKNSRP